MCKSLWHFMLIACCGRHPEASFWQLQASFWLLQASLSSRNTLPVTPHMNNNSEQWHSTETNVKNKSTVPSVNVSLKTDFMFLLISYFKERWKNTSSFLALGTWMLKADYGSAIETKYLRTQTMLPPWLDIRGSAKVSIPTLMLRIVI